MTVNKVFERSYRFSIKNADCMTHVRNHYGKNSDIFRKFMNGGTFKCSMALEISAVLSKKHMSAGRAFVMIKVM